LTFKKQFSLSIIILLHNCDISYLYERTEITNFSSFQFVEKRGGKKSMTANSTKAGNKPFIRKPRMTKEERRAKYTAIAKKRREKQKNRQGGRQFGSKRIEMVCFQCRQIGHTVRNCPMNEGNANNDKNVELLCYKCGSTEHSLGSCPKRDNNRNDLPYAKCFICNEKGHLASSCPQNKKGIYVNGGSCRHCGSRDHLATACTMATNAKKKKKEITGVETDVDDLLEKPKEKSSKEKKPDKTKTRRVVKF
jgi:zinc finger CCHC domain-containing protein 9